MATALSNLLALLALDNSAYLEGLTGSQAASDSFATKLSNVGGAVVLGGLTAAATAVVGIGAAAFDAAETIDGAMDKIAVSTGATGPALDGLRQDFDSVFSSVPTDAESAATAISILNSRLDVSGETLQNLAKPMLEVTRILGGDLTSNTESFTRVIGDWNIPVDQAAGSLDKLFVAAQSAGVPLDTLMERIVQYGAPMRNFGFGFEETAALMAQWEAQGVNVEIVMAGLRTAQGKFISQGVDMKTGLWDTVDAIQNASSATEGLSIATKIFGAKAAGDMYDTIMAGKFDIDALTASMQNADGAIMDAAKSTMDWTEMWTMFKNSFTTAIAPVGDKLREGVGKALEEVIAIFQRPEVQEALTKITEAVVIFVDSVVSRIPDLINGMMRFFNFLQNNQGIVIGIFAALGVAVVAWGVVTAAAAWAAVAPFLPVIAVLVAVAAAAYLLYQAWQTNFGGIQEKTQEIMSTLMPIIQEIGAKMKELFQSFDWGPFKEALTNLLPVLGAVLASVLAAVLGLVQGLLTGMSFFLTFANMIATGLSNIVSGVINIFSGLFGFLYDLFTGNFGKLGEDLKNLGLGIVQVFMGTIQLLVGSVMGPLAFLTGFIGGFVTGVIDFFQMLYDVLVGNSIVPDMMNAMISVFALGLNTILSDITNGVANIVGVFTGLFQAVTSGTLIFEDGSGALQDFAVALGFPAQKTQDLLSAIWLLTSPMSDAVVLFEDGSGALLDLAIALGLPAQKTQDLLSAIWLVTSPMSDAILLFEDGSGALLDLATAFGFPEQAAQDFLTTTYNVLTSFSDAWTNVGSGITTGIAEGISSGAGYIVDAAVSAAQAALDAAMNFLGINSPSTVFEKEVGYQMAAGVAAGWDNGMKSLIDPAMANLQPANVNIQPSQGGTIPMKTGAETSSQSAGNTIIINNPVPERSAESVRKAMRMQSYFGAA
jgi:hypothetical protein